MLEPIIDAFYNLVNKIKYINERDNADNNIGKIKYNQIYEIKNENKTKVEIINILDNIKKEEDKEENNINKDSYKEINYIITIKLLQIFLKIFAYIGILIIPYYLLIGKEFMGLIYGRKWETKNIEKIGDCYSYYIIFASVLDLIKSFGNATNNTHQMKLSNLSLIINSIFLSLLMYIFSKWDICGLIISNQISSIFLININLFIIFCGKKNESNKHLSDKSPIILDIQNFIIKSFISKKSIIISFFLIILSNLIKKKYLFDSFSYIKILIVSLIGIIHIFFLFLFEKGNFLKGLNIIKSY